MGGIQVVVDVGMVDVLTWTVEEDPARVHAQGVAALRADVTAFIGTCFKVQSGVSLPLARLLPVLPAEEPGC